MFLVLNSYLWRDFLHFYEQIMTLHLLRFQSWWVCVGFFNCNYDDKDCIVTALCKSVLSKSPHFRLIRLSRNSIHHMANSFINAENYLWVNIESGLCKRSLEKKYGNYTGK